MEPADSALEENLQQLRRTMRDLVALSTLPAVWIGLGFDGIASSLANVLLHTLSLDLIYVRLAGQIEGSVIEIVRSTHQSAESHDKLVKVAVAPLLRNDRSETPAEIAHPFADGSLRTAITRFGVADDYGILIAGSRQADFPTERDRLLLGVGANQTAIVVQRLRAEERLREQGERLRTTLASIGDAVITTDTAGCVTNLNSVAESLTGWTSAEAVGQPLDAVFRIVNETSRQPVENPAMRALREGVVVGLANHTILVAKDGTERPIDDSAAPIRSREGGIDGCVLIFRDITDRMQAEEALRQSHTRFEALFSAAPVGIYVVDQQLRIRQVNPKARPVFGEIDGLIGSDFVTVIHVLWPHHVANEIISRFRHTLTSGEPYRNSEFIEERHDTKEREYYDWQIHRISLPEGEYGVVCYFTDISPHVLARRKLADADRRKDEFLATLAHELRNPLAPLRNGLQVMKLTRNDGDSIQHTRTMMERQVTQLVRLVDDLMDISRITTGKIELRKERVELSAIVNNAVETSRPLIEQMGHELTVMLPQHPIFVEADMTRLSQVILNLLNNAAKYSNRGGQIWLNVERQGDDVVVSVKDTGIGIAADKLTSIFEMFSQVDRSLEKSQGGLGVGLTLVKRLVEMHGGTVEGRSKGLGKGSEFDVRLPILIDASQPNAEERNDESSPKSSLRILIVDDNRDGAESLAMMLKLLGNETRTAYDGEEAVALSDLYRPDVILLDIGLPKLNGYEACRRIRKEPWGKKIVIIAQTGWGQDGDRQRTHEAGFDHHIVKPVDVTTLMKMLVTYQEVKS